LESVEEEVKEGAEPQIIERGEWPLERVASIVRE